MPFENVPILRRSQQVGDGISQRKIRELLPLSNGTQSKIDRIDETGGLTVNSKWLATVVSPTIPFALIGIYYTLR